MRKAIVSGQFYPADKTELEEQIKNFLKINPNKNIKAIIVPHAGYMFSGKCAGKAYSILPEVETYIIIGVNHHGIGKNVAVSLEDFETPLGIVRNDSELAKEILKEIDEKEDNNAHKFEHSIEVQLPFLQVSQRNFKIVPIILKNYNIEVCRNLAKVIFNSGKKLKRKIMLIASSDFTHSGYAYGNSIDMKIDKKAINEILKLNSEGFMEIEEKTTICGAGAIAVVIEFAKFLNIKLNAKLLDYYTSADIMPSENKVGYAAIAFFA